MTILEASSSEKRGLHTCCASCIWVSVPGTWADCPVSWPVAPGASRRAGKAAPLRLQEPAESQHTPLPVSLRFLWALSLFHAAPAHVDVHRDESGYCDSEIVFLFLGGESPAVNERVGPQVTPTAFVLVFHSTGILWQGARCRVGKMFLLRLSPHCSSQLSWIA